MHLERAHGDALRIARQIEHINSSIAAAVMPLYPHEARTLKRTTRIILRRIHDSADCVDTPAGQALILDAMVWSVEALIVLNFIRDVGEQVSLVGAASEALERLEEALRRIWPLEPPLIR